MSEKILGIDLGTTNSMAAFVQEDGVELLETNEITTYTPSIISYTKNGILIGKKAKQNRTLNPKTTFYSFKRFMGKNISEIQDDISHFPFSIFSEKNGTILLGTNNKPISPEQASAEILKHIQQKSELILGTPIQKAVITVPAYFNEPQRQATQNAAKLAGIDIARIINEPTAAAIAYGLDEKKDGNIVVFDFGGGTFDVSILQLKGKIFKVLSTHGNTLLGGDDIDQKIIQDIFRKSKTTVNQIHLDSKDKQKIKQIAEEIKIKLTSELEVTYQVSLQSIQVNYLYQISKQDFETLIQPIVQKTLDHIQIALQNANLETSDIDEVVMVGGSTRIPLVRKQVETFFQLQPHIRLNPDHVVAFGAAIQAHLLSGGRRDFLLMDVIPLSLGIETANGTFSKLIMQNASIPAKVTETFSTSLDNQTVVEINIYQGEREFVKDCKSLGKFKLKGIPPMPAGLPRVEVTFLVDANGLLTVTAKELRSNIQTEIEIIPTHGLNPSKIKEIIEDSVDHAMEDFEQRNLVDFRRQAQQILQGLDKVWSQADSFLSKSQQKKIIDHKKILQQLIQQEDPTALKQGIDKMGELTREFADSIMGNIAKKELI